MKILILFFLFFFIPSIAYSKITKLDCKNYRVLEIDTQNKKIGKFTYEGSLSDKITFESLHPLVEMPQYKGNEKAKDLFFIQLYIINMKNYSLKVDAFLISKSEIGEDYKNKISPRHRLPKDDVEKKDRAYSQINYNCKLI